MQTQPNPTLDDVARRAGVSTATVSRCLNAPAKVSGKTRERVMAAVTALGYTPHFGARAMAARRTHTIGAVIPTMENAVFARGLQAFQEGLHAAGYTLLVASSAYDPVVEAEQVRALVARGADGLLLIGRTRDRALTDFLSARGVPALLAWVVEGEGVSVGFDNRAAMRALAEAVLAEGHRRIAMISGLTTGNDRASERLAGLREALAAAGLTRAGLPLEEVPYGIETGGAAFARLMEARPRPTAVMCGNDVLAAGALAKAAEMGLRVPEDVSITGFDDIELARIVPPGLTTAHVPHRDMGARAAEVLIALVEGGDAASVTLACPVVRRGSLGPPRG